MSLSEIAQSGGIWAGYAAGLGARSDDEAVGPTGVRDGQQETADSVERLGLTGLLAARAEARRLVAEDGVRSSGGVRGRAWGIDPLPLVIPAAQWAVIEGGLQQRARLLDALLSDLYRERRTLRDGLIPVEVIAGHPGFLPQAHGVRHPGANQLVLTGTDVGRVNGEWFVLGDRAAVPAGMGYAMVNRRIVSRALASVHRGTRLRRLREFYDSIRIALDGLSPRRDHQPKVALLWPGARSEGAFEMGFLATMLGLSLVEGDDLVTRDGQVLVDARDRRTRIDVLLRRVDAADCDPLDLRPGSPLGVPGLVEAARRGRVSVANPLGADVLENPGLIPFLPAVSRALLGEELIVHSADTFWCGDPTAMSHVTSRLDTLLVRPIHRGATGSVQGWTLARGELDNLRAAIVAQPWAWVGQDPLFASTTPVVTGKGLVSRRVVVRAFGVSAGDDYQIMPGGLARVAPENGAFKVSRLAGALSKDVWVLDDAAVPSTITRSPASTSVIAIQAWTGRTLAPRTADNLFWFGRYSERLDATARLLRQAIDLSEDHADRPGTTGHAVFRAVSRLLWSVHGLALESSDDSVQARASLREASVDPTVVGSLSQCFEGLEGAADEVPTVMSTDVWHVMAAIRRRLEALAGNPADFQAGLLDLRQSTLALFGVASESLMRDQSWAYIDAGIRVERVIKTMTLIATAFDSRQPLIVLGRLSEILMETCDSAITHRRRSAAGIGPTDPLNACAALLVLERANPRAAIPQLESLAADLRILADEQFAGRADALVERLTAASAQLTEDDGEAVTSIMWGAISELEGLVADLAVRYFTRATPPRAVQVSWPSGVPLGAEGGWLQS